MNRTSRVSFSLSKILVVLTALCTPVVAKAATVFTPTFGPAAGSYTGTQSVTLSDTTSGATIYYTTNGTTPSSSSTKYAGAISVSTSETIKAIAELSGDTNSAVASAAYTITVSTPTFSPAAGSYTGTQSVTLSDTTSGATIYYTTNGTTPSSSSTKYTGAISVSTSETIKAIAELSGDTNSAVASAAYTITVSTPTFSPAAGSYIGTQSVTFSDTTSGATIYYTTDGTTPSSSSTRYTGAIPVSTSETIKAIAELSGATNSAVASAAYTITVSTPTFSPAAGSYTGTQSVTLSDATSGATIYYTTDGTTPSSSATRYTGAISVSTSETIKAIAELSGDTNSAVATAAYTITPLSGTLTVYIDAPAVQSSSVSGVTTVTFDALTTGIQTVNYQSAIGTYAVPFDIHAPGGLYGGANNTNYFSVGGDSGSTSPAYLTLTQPASYVGFWWAAGDANNRVALYSGSTLYGTFSTADLLNILHSGSGTVTALNGSTYNTSAYFGNPNLPSGSNDGSEPFAYVSFVITGATINKIAFYNTTTGSSFESDNHSVISSGSTVTIPTTLVPVESMSLGTQSISVTVAPASANVNAGGTQQFTATVTGSTNTAVTWTISPTTGTGTVSTSGLYTAPTTVTTPQTATITATSQANTTVSASGTVNLRATPTLSVASSSNPSTYGGSVTFTATISSGPTGTITFYDSGTSIGTGTISGTTATLTTTSLAAGSHTITAGWAGNTNYSAVTSSAITQTVNQAAPTISFTVPNQTDGVAPFTVSATSNSSGAITYSVVSGPATISGSTVTITGVGTVALKASQVASGNYAAGTQTTSFTVAAAAPTITFTVPNQTYGVAPFTVSATSNSSGAITYSVVSGPATISGSTVTITGVGTVVLQASQAASGNYAAGTQTASFTVVAAGPTITFTVPNQTYGVAPFTVSATSNSSGVITYSVVSGPATISGSTVTITGVGTVVLQASQAASGNYAAGTQTASFTVAAAGPTITFTVPNQTYGVAPFTVSATSNSSGAITYSVVSGPATISGSTVTITGVGTVALKASQVASGNYAAGTQNASFTVTAEAQTITFTALASPVTYGVAPVALSASASSGLAVIFSIVSGSGTISGSTLTITGPGTVVVAANQPGNADFSAAPQVTQSIVVNSAVSITLTPFNAVLTGGQSQQFTATVMNTTNTAVNWSISPTGVGSISSSGLYTAQATIGGQQVVTITATSQADTSATATATVNLAPACATNGYSYVRAITIDHTKVPNTDQINFPFLFNTTDPLLATSANGGHVASPDGYDIIFTSDSAGQNPLPYEMEEYNPATGQVIAWVQIPDISHSSDTVIYLFYGNPNISAPQQNPTAVWNANYQAVWHLPNGTTLSANDSTANANNAIIQGSPAAISGEIWGGASFNSGSYLVPANYISLSSGTYTLSTWFQTPLPTTNDGWNTLFRGSEDHEIIVHESDWTLGSYDNTGGTGYNSSGFAISSLSSGWHYLVAVSSGSTLLFYVDGNYVGASSFLSTNDVETIGNYRGDGNQQWGSADEIRVSNSARSADWIATEYANQGSPATFYSLTAENAVEAVPTAVSLLASQSQQFSIPGMCNTSVDWSMPNNAPGTLSSSGLYTAPASITQQQTVTITAQTQSNNDISATVTLIPQIWPNGGPAGTVIAINGQGFGSAEGPSSVTVGGLAAVTLAWSDSQIQVQIPTGTGLGSQQIVVTVGNQAIAQTAFAVTSGLVGITPSRNEIAAATTINSASQTAPLIFTGTAGQLVSVQLLNSTFPGWGSPLTFTILNPDGSTLTNQGIYNGSVTSPATLPATGIYTLVANPQGGTGSANINLWEYSNLTGTTSSGVQNPVSINIPAQEELLSFNCTAGQIASVQLASSTFPGWGSPLTFTILNPDGSTLTNQGIYNGSVTSPVTLSQTGTCTLVINPQGGTGSAVVTLWEYGNLTGIIFPGIPYPLTINIPAQEALLSFNGTAGKIVNVQLSGSTFPGWGSPLTFTILNPDGSTLTNQGIYNGSVTNFVTLPTTGTYTLVVNPQGGTGSARLLLTETVASITVAPPGVTLVVGQTEQFTANVTSSTSNPTITWTLSPATIAGTISSSGLYTAPATISAQQIVTVTASAATSNGNLSGTAQVKLTPPSPMIAVQPLSVTLIGGQTQQYYTSLTNVSNTAVTWSMSPAGAGTISASGLYTAPPVVTSQQVVTITATSQAVPSLSTSATLTLLPAADCAAQSYGYERPIVIDHTKVPESDQPHFPFYFAATDPLLATIANGGHMASANGYDIQFSSDPAGQHALSYELEQYNAATGQIIAWVQVPVLSHVQDTVIYMFYGNSAITAPQQNPAGVWDSNYLGVYQFDGPQSGVVLDSTINGNNAVEGGLQQAAGTPDGAATFDGAASFVLLPTNDFASFPVNGSSETIFNSSFAAWFKTDSAGVILGQTGAGGSGGGVPALYIDTTGNLRANFFNLQDAQQIVSPTAFNDNNWHYAVFTFDTNSTQNTIESGGGVTSTTSGIETLYVDGQVIGSQTGAVPNSYSSAYSYFLGTGYASGWANTPNLNNSWFYFNGSLDEVEISSIARSSSWLQTEYHNQGSPSTFFVLGSEASTTPSVNPGVVTLYQSQSQQFTVLQTGLCNAGDAVWSMPTGSPGTLSPTGLYIAPATINTQQPLTVTATTLGANSTPVNAAVTLMPPVTISLVPGTAALPAGGTQQFTATVANTTNTAVTWTIDPAGEGFVGTTGLYTAPATLNGQQTVNVIATSQADPTQSASATITIGATALSGSAVTINPTVVTLSAGQTQQFTASVTNETNANVTWSSTPAGVGTIDTNGFYTAPESITAQQTVTITATSQAAPTQSASAMVTLSPNTCDSAGYGYQRVIVIDHTKVANTDQTNFPFLFNSTDPDLATVDNGGHVANPNGYDIIFSSDPNGQTKLDFEVEQYNPATGQLVSWIRIPTLSHSADTVIYVFYGNPAITTSQANPTGVWDSDYQAVYHLGSLPSTEIASDSTNNANNAPFTNFTPIPGQIDGSAGLDGVTSFLEIPSNAFPSYPTGVYSNLGVNTTWNNTTFSATFGIWFKTTSWGGLLDQTAGDSCLGFFGICLFPSLEQPGTGPYGSWASMLDVNFDGQLEARGVSPTTQIYNDNNWHYGVVTFENGVDNLYADGQLVGTGSQGTFGYNPTYAYFVGTEDAEADTSSLDSQPWKYLPGQIDEVSVSSTARSGDWIQTQFNNQSSPFTFYKFYSPNAIQVAPSAISLYAFQSELFVVPASCDATITWSLTAGSTGTLTSAGLYTAPSVVSSQQTVTISAVSQSNGSSLGSAQVTLLPAPLPLTLVASSPSPYQVGSSQTFTATLLDQQGKPLTGVAVNFTVAGPNETVGNVTTSASGTASFTYTGSNSGTDTVQATASVNGALLTSNSLTAAWLAPPPAQAPTLTLLPQTSPGRGALMGAFTDNNGDVIEPIVIGTAARTFITPAGATRLQLGIDDTYYEQNGGAGFVVRVNGVNVTVPPTAMPWNWTTGSLNNNYQYGVNDGSSPVIAASSLAAGQPVTVAYQSGTISTNYPINPLVDANGETALITGTQLYNGTYFPTLYTTGASYPQNQPINVFATVVDASGAPIPNTPVTLTISGANAGQYQATTDATGTASFLYTGQYAGNDSLQAQATLAGQGGTLGSNLTTIDWTNYPTPPPAGSLSLYFIVSIVNDQRFTVLAKDASGNVLPNVSVGCYVTGIESLQTSSSTNNLGEAGCGIYHNQSSSYGIFAVDTVDRNVLVTQPYTGNWTVPTGSPSAAGGTITVGISADTTVTMPNSLQLTGTVTDNSGLTPTVAWTQVSGPGTVTFATPNQASTTATFSQIGTYVLQLSANDTVNSGFAQFTVTVLAPSVVSQAQGWIGTPTYGSSVSGIVPITLAPGITLASGTLSYMPANNPNNVTVLNPNVSGSGQIGTLDTTMLANGSFLIQMQATDNNGNPEYSLVQVTVTGNYKPGHVTSTITDLVVPATGMAIQIQRTYDSLNAGTSGDFGYGWNLGINVNLTVDASGNVTFTLHGQRKTFYLTPLVPSGFGGVLFPYYFVAYTPEPGLTGTLSDAGSGCAFDLLEPNGSLWQCYNQGTQFNPTTYVYTDATGTQYIMSAGGQLRSMTDKNGNGLTITPYGITSTTGLNVPFVRDSQNRITQITDPAGNVYLYQYETNGDLASVTYPNTPQPSTYTYDQSHFYLTGTDFRNNPLPVTAYYGAGDMDASGSYSVADKLQSVTDAVGNTTSYTYNLATNTTTITYPPDANGNVGTETMVYDSNGDVLSSTDPLGHSTTNTYDANFNLLSTTDPLGRTTSYTYDANGNKTSTSYPATATSTNTTSTTNYNQLSGPTSITDENGNTRTFNYDANYNPRSVTDAVGTLISTQFNNFGQMVSAAIGYDITQNPARASQLTYDANGNLASRTDALGRTTSFTYNALGQKITMIEPVPAGSTTAAATTTYTYDAFGNLIQTQAPLGRVTSSTYDASGNKTSDTDARSNTTQYKYDALNRLIETDYPDGTKKTVDLYDFRNNVVHETDQNGNVTYHQYDLAGRQIAVTHAYGTASAITTAYAYNNAGRVTSQTDALGHATTYTYDAAGNLLSTSGVGGSFTFTYDNAGNQVSLTDGNGNTTHFSYDARRRLTVTTYPDTRTKTNAYDGPGNLISVTDQAGNQVQYNYDVANQLINVVQVNSPNTSANTTIYGYDANGNPITLEDANTHTTTNAFDLLSEQTSKVLPDATHTEIRAYDNNGNLATITHFNGVATSYTYDPLNRLLSRSTPGEVTVSHTYTATGQYASTSDASGSTTYTYDKMDRITAKITPEGTLNYTYDAAGHMASISSSNVNGASMSYTYDDLNRLSTVTDNRTGGVTTYNYDNASNVATVTYPNGVQSTFTYDTLNRVAGLSSQPASYTYQRGPTGNLLSASESSGRQVNWSYDGIYRLTSETISLAPSHNNGSVTYGLDPVGNRDSVVSGLGGVSSGTWSFNADDELASETYDANDNVIATGGKIFTYNSQNQITSMTASGTTATMVYDAFGERVSKTVNGATTQYLVEDDKNPTGLPQVFDELTNGVVTRTYTYGLQRIDEEQIANGSLTPSYYGYDGGGNVRNLTDSAGAVTDEYEYDAFGNMFTVSGTTPNNYLYRGEQYDSDLGLYYLRARYYNPTTGRFMSRDPEDGKLTNPKSLHKYLYANGDPVNMRDPLGREALIEYAFMTIGKPVGDCLLQVEDSVGACLVDKAKDAAQDFWLGRIPNPGAGSAWAFGKQMGGCVIAAFTGIADILNTISEGGTVDQNAADQVGEDLEKCAYETVKEELGTVITTMLVPNPPE